LELNKGDGKIEVMEEDDEKGPGERRPVKYRYFIMKRPRLPAEFDKYFKRFDWKQKGVIRHRYEDINRPKFIKYPYKVSDLKERLGELKNAIKSYEDVGGKQ